MASLTVAPRAACGAAFLLLIAFQVPSAWGGMAPAKISAQDLALARDYVLAACVMDRYKGTSLAEEADAWAGGLVEHGGLNADAYPALTELARKAPEPGVTQAGMPMRLQSCVDFVNAKGFSVKLKEALRR